MFPGDILILKIGELVEVVSLALSRRIYEVRVFVSLEAVLEQIVDFGDFVDHLRCYRAFVILPLARLRSLV